MDKMRIKLILLICVICGLFCFGAKSCVSRSKNKAKTGSSIPLWTINAPSNLIASAISITQINLSWQDNSNNEDGFEIWRTYAEGVSASGGDYSLLTTVYSNVTYYTDTTVTSTNTYYYRVRAFNSIGDRSDYSNEANAFTFDYSWLPRWAMIRAGEIHSLALGSDGTVWAWGNNEEWQLGIGDSNEIRKMLPTRIEIDFNNNSFRDISVIAAGWFHSLAVKTDGSLWGWGTNGAGQLGTGDTLSVEAPYQAGTDSDWAIPSGMNVATLDAGYGHSIALKTNRTIWTWGFNDYKQLGRTGGQRRPRQVGTDSDWASVTAGMFHTLAIKTNPDGSIGTLWAWGQTNSGQLGIGEGVYYPNRATPVQAGTDSDWSISAAGNEYTLAIKTNGTLWSCGNNGYGQLGLGDDVDKIGVLTQVGTESDWASVTAGWSHTLATKINQTLWTWGYNNYGSLGVGDYITRKTPTQIGTDSTWASIAAAAGETHSLAVKTDNSIWGWGTNAYGQLGFGDNFNWNIPHQFGSPVQPSSLVAQAVSSTQINLSWYDNSFNEIGFEIERGITNTNYLFLTTVSSNVVSYLDEGLTVDTSYYYRIRAFNNFGISYYYSSYAAVATPTFFAPTNLTAQVISVNEIRLSWQDNSIEETGFEIERTTSAEGGPDSGWMPLASLGPNVTLYSDTTLTRGNAYYYRIKAIYGAGESIYSNIVAPKTWFWTPQLIPFSARAKHSMVWDPVRKKIIMFGGFGSENNLWWYDPQTNTWEEKITQGSVGSPLARYGHSMVWDSDAQRVIMFGGDDGMRRNDLWWYDPSSGTTGAWAKMINHNTPGSPSARRYHSMVWDPIGQRVIMFGGNDGVYKNDLWWYDPTSGTNGAWIEMTTSAISPTARENHSMVWDTVGQRVIMFGGNSLTYMNDLWSYDPQTNTWEEKITQDAEGSPSARHYHSMVWDPVSGGMIMFGGSIDAEPYYTNDLWWYDPASGTSGAWIDKSTTAISPTARYSHSMVWDTVGQRVIMFGGNSLTYMNDLWSYDPQTNDWEEKITQDADGSPSARNYHSMVWDTVGERVIMFGGYNAIHKNDLWWYDPQTNIWEEKITQDSEGSPSARYAHSMVWDTVGQKVIMFGGTAITKKNDLWWYDPSSGTTGAWTKMLDQDAPGSPSSRNYHSMVWDPVGARVIMFGGNSSGYKNDLWWYDPASGTTGAWIEMTTAAISPTARHEHSMVWDPVRQKVIMFGGHDGVVKKNDLWWYDPQTNTWEEKITQDSEGSPLARIGHSMVWDSDAQKVIMFGGNSLTYMNDLWSYDPATNVWTMLIPQNAGGSPSSRRNHSMVWDTTGNRLIMFGGADSSPKNDLWWWR